MWKCGYRYLSCEKLHKICQLVPTLQIREQLVNFFFSAVSCSFLNASIHFLWTLNYAMTEYRVFLLTANFSICVSKYQALRKKCAELENGLVTKLTRATTSMRSEDAQPPAGEQRVEATAGCG